MTTADPRDPAARPEFVALACRRCGGDNGHARREPLGWARPSGACRWCGARGPFRVRPLGWGCRGG